MSRKKTRKRGVVRQQSSETGFSSFLCPTTTTTTIIMLHHPSDLLSHEQQRTTTTTSISNVLPIIIPAWRSLVVFVLILVFHAAVIIEKPYLDCLGVPKGDCDFHHPHPCGPYHTITTKRTTQVRIIVLRMLLQSIPPPPLMEEEQAPPPPQQQGYMFYSEYYRQYVPTSHIKEIATSHRLDLQAPTKDPTEVRMSILARKAGNAMGPLLTITLTLSSSSLLLPAEVALKSATSTKMQSAPKKRRRMATKMIARR